MATILLLAATFSFNQARAEHLSFRTYGAVDGLTNLSGTCNALAGPGYLLICSEHGVFFYDGRMFHNLGTAQGLPDGGFADDIALTRDGRVAVRFPDKLFISDRPVSLGHSPASLQFRSVELGSARLFSNYTNQMVRYGNGLAVIAGGDTEQVVSSPAGTAALEPIRYDDAERQILADPTALFQVDQHLWETFEDGRICLADPGFVRCYPPAPGAGRVRWHDIVKGDGDTIRARSDDGIATLDPRGSIQIEQLPDQGGSYAGYAHALGLFTTPTGEMMTQSAHGLLIRKASGWVRLADREGIQAGTITSVVVDSGGQLWLQVYGRGLFRGLNYGHWENLQRDDGLSPGSAWQTIRAGASIWVATDTGVDEVKRRDGDLQVVQTVPNVSYTVLSGPDGSIWTSAGKTDVLVFQPATGGSTRLALPFLNCAAATDRRVWLGTQHGLYHVDVLPGRPLVPTLDRTTDVIDGLASDGSSGVWVIKRNRIWHAYRDGRLVPVSGRWPAGEFEPLSIAPAAGGHLWIGGAGGLYDLTVSNDRVTGMLAVSPASIRTNSVVSVMVDRRGWVWVGTGQGVSVFNGHRWVSTDADMGLVWNDVSEGGLFNDPDGSVWISTSFGVSHLLDPEWLFEDRPVTVAVSQATIGDTSLPPGSLPFTDAPLSLQFGTLSFGSEQSITFRYKLSGVDENWDESTTGSVRYASIPPGRHVLTLVGYDSLSHILSEPVTLVIKMAFPWWRTWWADAAYLLLGSVAFFGFLRFRDRASTAAQRKLEALVAERTRGLQLAQAELKHQASVDSLTGLLNRRETRERLQNRLSSAHAGDTLVAMLDVDHFKRVNDQHGHLIGDELLCAIGIRISAMLHDDECAGRFGGEEFILVLGDRDGRGAERILVLHQMIRQNPFHFTSTSVSVTCSIGLAWAGPGDDWTSLIGRADVALYEAKTTGRDRVIESHDDQALIIPSSRPGLG